MFGNLKITGLNNKLSFKEKGLLIEGPAEDDLCVNKALIPIVIGDRLQLTIILKIKNETED